MNIREKLCVIQHRLNAPKNQYNSFGKYNYRSCEDILMGVKPLLEETKTILTVSDDIVMIGDRYYIKAVAVLSDCESDEAVTNTAYARESNEKKGMDASQVTGTASSYARKYALNGLFAIDDNKDADTDSYSKAQQKADKPPNIYKCCDCGREFKEFEKDGKVYPAKMVYELSKKKNHDGKARCGECMKKKEDGNVQ